MALGAVVAAAAAQSSPSRHVPSASAAVVCARRRHRYMAFSAAASSCMRKAAGWAAESFNSMSECKRQWRKVLRGRYARDGELGSGALGGRSGSVYACMWLQVNCGGREVWHRALRVCSLVFWGWAAMTMRGKAAMARVPLRDEARHKAARVSPFGAGVLACSGTGRTWLPGLVLLCQCGVATVPQATRLAFGCFWSRSQAA